MNRVASLSEKARNELFTLTAERRGMGTVAGVKKAMAEDYLAMKEMIFGRCPSFEEIITSLIKLETEINEPEGSNNE